MSRLLTCIFFFFSSFFSGTALSARWPSASTRSTAAPPPDPPSTPCIGTTAPPTEKETGPCECFRQEKKVLRRKRGEEGCGRISRQLLCLLGKVGDFDGLSPFSSASEGDLLRSGKRGGKGRFSRRAKKKWLAGSAAEVEVCAGWARSPQPAARPALLANPHGPQPAPSSARKTRSPHPSSPTRPAIFNPARGLKYCAESISILISSSENPRNVVLIRPVCPDFKISRKNAGLFATFYVFDLNLLIFYCDSAIFG